MHKAKYKAGDKVAHPANADGHFPAGEGKVVCSHEWNTGDGCSYILECVKTGRTLPVIFKESELTPCD